MRYLRIPGENNSIPILLVHGLIGYSFSWRFNMKALARERTVYAVDLPGIGFSQRRRESECNLRTIAEGLCAFLREQRIGVVDVVGSSHGGAVTMMLAALGESRRSGPRVRRMVLSAPVNPWSRHGRVIAQLLATRAGGALFRHMRPHLSPLHGRVLSRMYGDPLRISAGTLEGYEAPLKIEGTSEHLLAIMRCWRRDMGEIEVMLPSIRHLPTLLIWGDKDKAVLPQSAEPLKAHLQQAELVLIRGAGHLPYEEVPDQFNSAVNEFLGR
jgi:pimeloyl-ACP methyl ester carboxylesterase